MRKTKPKAPTEGGDTRVSPSVEVVPTNATPLIEILPFSKFWENPQLLPKTLAAMRGAIVKGQPPEGATDEQLLAFKAACAKAGALHVRVLPRQRAKDAVPAGAEPAGPLAHRDLRAAVLETAAASTYPDKAALLGAIEPVLAAVGL